MAHIEALTSELDEKGRNAIHLLVNTDKPNLSIDKYHSLIEKFIKAGVDVNLQDESGMTPLHLATDCRNQDAIEALFKCGADPNVADSSGKTALVRASELHSSGDDKSEATFAKLASQARTLERLGIQLSESNRSALERRRTQFRASSNALHRRLAKDLAEAKKFAIDENLLLSDFVPDYGPVNDYHSMSAAKRSRIDEILKSVIDGDEFSELRGLLRLQYKKATDRSSLIGSATRAMAFLFWLRGLTVPNECSLMILTFTGNVDLINFISALNENVMGYYLAQSDRRGLPRF